MAKQNKGRKFFAASATAALVASAIVPVASAAQVNDYNKISGYAKEAVQALVDQGVIQGDTNGNFNPLNTVTRAQAAEIFTKALELEANGDVNFKDVKAGAWYYNSIAAVVANGIFEGVSATEFAPNKSLTRSEAAKVLVDAFGLEGSESLSQFADASQVKPWAKTALETAVANGIFTGSEENGKLNLKPNAAITRQDFAVVFARTLDLVDTETPVDAAIKAINNTTVEVTFDEEVDTDNVKAGDFKIDGLEITNASVKQTNKKVVVLTTAAQTAGTEYVLSLKGEELGKFKGIAAVIPTKVDIVEKSVQGKLGQQVTVKAQVTVAEGASKEGIPVTFFIPGSSDGIKAPVTVEATTDANGVATHSYTRYAATNDTVTAYATGDRSKFSTGYVFWAVDTTLAITEVTEGATINNGANKTYKVTYKDPTTGKPVSGKTLNVSVKENIDVTVDKLQNVTVNGTAVVQTSDTNTRAAQIKTDSKGEATFTVSGSNAEVTPVVFDAATITTTQSNGTVLTTGYSQKYTADTLQATAPKVTFGAVQADYVIEVNRDGGEVAATGLTNGRKYNVVVKTKDGKLAANETVNVAFNEDIDGVISTVTNAQFVKVEDGKQVAWNGKKITVKTNSKGEASFIIGTETGNVNTYATPIAWIDINNQSGKDANLDKGEPTAVAPITYFQAEYLDGSKLVSKNAKGEETDKFDGGEAATFEVKLTNQSGKTVANSGYTTKDVSYTVYNTGAENVKVNGEEIAPNRVYTVIAPDGKITVTSVDGKSTSVKVLATGVAKQVSGNKEFAFTAKEATATFTDSKEITNPYTGVLDLTSIDKKEKEIKFAGKTKAVSYAGESGKTYKYYGIGNTTIANADAFIALLEDYAAAGKTIRATYEVKDDVVTFTIISETTSGTVTDVVAKVNAATTATQVENAIKGLDSYKKLTPANQTLVVNTILGELQGGKVYTSASLELEIAKLIVVGVTAVVTEGTTGVTGEKATGVYANATTSTNTLTIESANGATEYNGVKVVFEKNTTVGTAVTTAYDLQNKTLTVKLPVNVGGAVDTAATWTAVANAIGADSSTTLTGTVAGFNGADSASELVGQTIELKGATPTTVTTADKLVLTFSEAITTAPTGLVFTGASTLGTTPTITLSADKKTVTITVDPTDGNIVVGDTITALTGIAFGVTGQSVTFPINVTK